MIARENYESYFIDYLEGNLDENQVDEFLEFIQQNPDLKEELKELKNFNAECKEVVFPFKEKLYHEKLDSEEEFSEAAIALLENGLTSEEARIFNEYLKRHPQKEKEFRIFRQIVLKSDDNIIYPRKNRLYRHKAITLNFVFKVAASIILILAVSALLYHTYEIVPHKEQLAETSAEKNLHHEKGLSPAGKNETQKTEIAVDETAQPPERPSSKYLPPVKKPDRNGLLAKKEEKNSPVVRDQFLPSALKYKASSVPEANTGFTLAAIAPETTPDSKLTEPGDENLLLVERIAKHAGAKPVNLASVAKIGLDFVSVISNKKFTYQTDKSGKITEYNYESNLLAFTIPGRVKVQH